ncbi:MAG: chromate efflux transporter, partial [Sandaracinaceae bacterium]|nr:chromate efflux transporter [Sandaracinaceae bacterium]
MSDSPPREAAPRVEPPDAVSFREAVRVWARIGLLSFGGPAGQIALMHEELVEKRRWIDERRFLHALSYCTLLPGPEAQQLATYLGWLMHRTQGGIAAGTLFILPGALLMLVLSALYATCRDVTWIAGIFDGLEAVVLAIVIEALVRIGKRALRTRALVALAAAAFLALFVLEVPFPWVIAGAALIGAIGTRVAPSAFPSGAHGEARAADESLLDRMEARGELAHAAPSWSRALRVLVVCGALWALPFVLATALAGPQSVYLDEATFFSEVAMVTFGGAYAVLAYVAQRAVGDFGWLGPEAMVQGLGLAETTPGPLILVVEFVGFQGAFGAPGVLPPALAGVLGALVTLWVTFVPCFLWIFLGAPFVEALRNQRVLAAALSAITAAVVGVILNLSIWFALHVLFREVNESHVGPLRVLVPTLASLEWPALVIGVVGGLCLLVAKLG